MYITHHFTIWLCNSSMTLCSLSYVSTVHMLKYLILLLFTENNWTRYFRHIILSDNLEVAALTYLYIQHLCPSIYKGQKTAVTSGYRDEPLLSECIIDALMLHSDGCWRGPDVCRKLTRRPLETIKRGYCGFSLNGNFKSSCTKR